MFSRRTDLAERSGFTRWVATVIVFHRNYPERFSPVIARSEAACPEQCRRDEAISNSETRDCFAAKSAARNDRLSGCIPPTWRKPSHQVRRTLAATLDRPTPKLVNVFQRRVACGQTHTKHPHGCRWNQRQRSKCDAQESRPCTSGKAPASCTASCPPPAATTRAEQLRGLRFQHAGWGGVWEPRLSSFLLPLFGRRG